MLQAFRSRGNSFFNSDYFRLMNTIFLNICDGWQRKKEFFLFYMSVTQFYFCFICQWLNFISEVLFHSLWRGCCSQLFPITWLLLTHALGKYKIWTLPNIIQQNSVKSISQQGKWEYYNRPWGLHGLFILTTIFKVIVTKTGCKNKL